VAANDRAYDASVFSKSSVNQALERNMLTIQTDGIFFVDDAFPLRTNIVKPYCRKGPLDEAQKVFNYRLSCSGKYIRDIGFKIPNI
jgi:hypothetical protein